MEIRIPSLIRNYMSKLKNNSPIIRLKAIEELASFIEVIDKDVEYNDRFYDYLNQFLLILIDRLAIENSREIKDAIVEEIISITKEFVFSYEWIINRVAKISNGEGKTLAITLKKMQKERDKQIKYELAEQTNHRLQRKREEAINELSKIALNKLEAGVDINFIIDILINCLNDKEESIIEKVGYNLFLIQTDYVIEELGNILKNRNAYQNSTLIKTIKILGSILNIKPELKDNSIIKILKEFILEEDLGEEIRSISLWAFIILEEDTNSILSFTYDIYKNEKSQRLRKEAYEYLSIIIKGLGYNPSKIDSVINELITSDGLDQEEELQELILDLRPTTFIQRIIAIRKIKNLNANNEEVILALLHSIQKDQHPIVREESASALIELHPESLISKLMDIIGYDEFTDETFLAQKYAISILGVLGEKEIVPYISNFLQHPEAFLRSETAIAIGKLGAKKDIIDLVKLLADDSVSVRLEVVKSIFQLNKNKITPQLTQLLFTDKSSKIRKEILEMLRNDLPNNENIHFLKEVIQHDSSYKIRARAAELYKTLDTEPQKNEADANGDVKIQSVEITSRISLVFIAANPNSDQYLNQGKEIKFIENKLAYSIEKFDIKQKWAVNPSDLTQIFQLQPHFLHITCHGTDTGELIFEGEGDEEEISYKAKDIARRFENAKKAGYLNNLFCVFLSACHSDLIAEELLDSVDCVIAMSDSITDSSAKKFAGEFYKEVSLGENLLNAFLNAIELIQEEQEGNIPDIFYKIGSTLKKVTFNEVIDKNLQPTISSIRKPFETLFTILKHHEKCSDELIKQVISDGESDLVEFKSTLRWDAKELPFSVNEKRIAETIASFMNVKGGILFIGVSDDGKILGIEKDYSTLGKHQNKDGFSNQLKNVIRDNFDNSYPYEKLIHDNYILIENKEICIVYIEPCPHEVFIKDKNNFDIFSVRYYAQSKRLSGRSSSEYIRAHWKK